MITRTSRTALLALSLTLTGTVPGSMLLVPAAFAKGNTTAVDALYVEAQGKHEAGKTREASIMLRNLLRDAPDHAPARLLLGKIALINGELEAAEKEISRAAAIEPSDETAVLLGEIALQRNKPRQALAAVKGDGLTTEMTIQRLVVAGAANLELENFDESEANNRRVLELAPNRVEGHFGLARVYAGRKDYTAATDKLDEIVRGKPDYAAGWILRGEVSLVVGDKHAAFYSFDRAVDLQPDATGPLISRARAYLSNGDIEGARRDARRVADLSPNAPISHYLKSTIAFAEGDYDTANQAFTQLQRNFDQFSPAVLLGALIKTKRGELSQADALFVKYIAMEPDSLDARRALAALRLRMGQPSNAVDILSKLLKKTPDDPGALRTLASAYLAMDDYERARAAFETVAENGAGADAQSARNALFLLDPDLRSNQPELADFEMRMGLLKASDMLANDDIDGALAALDALGEDAADTASVLALRGGIAAAKGNETEARILLDRALERNPELLAALTAYEVLDRTPTETIERMRALLSRDPSSEMLALRLTRALSTLGRTKEAAEILRNQIRVTPQSTELSRALVAELMLTGNKAEAAAEAVRLSRLPGAHSGDLAFAATSLMDADDTAEAVRVSLMLARNNPDAPQGAIIHAEALASGGRVKEAYAVLRTGLQRWPSHVGLAGAMATIAIEQRDSAVAQEAANSLARHNPPAAASILAHSAVQLGQPDVAVKILEKAFGETPDSRLATALFTARRKAGREDAAATGMKRWMADNPRDRAAMMTYATAMLDAGNDAEAEKVYGALLKLEPRNPVALNNYAWLRHKTQRPDALDYAERAFRAAGASPQIADTYGWMLVEYGKLKLGLSLLERAARAAPDNPEIGYHYAAALSKAGRSSEARLILTGVLDAGGDFAKRTDAQSLMSRLE